MADDTAHRLQLHIDLRGYAPMPALSPAEVLASFLRACGVAPDQVPPDVDQAAALYRSTLAGRRVLVVLDNARTVDQVRPLLPGSPGCLVLVTSRDRLGGLVAREGALHLTLDVMDPGEAQTLLGRVLGQERLHADRNATAELVRLCASLPLALRIAAAHLAVDRRRTVASLVRDLAGDRRLATLAVAGDQQNAVRSAFDLSYAALESDPRSLFRLLGLVPGPDVTAEAAAALAGTSTAQASSLLERLEAAHLLDQPQPGRFAFHDLLRVYALERTEAEDVAGEREAATRRLVDAFLATVDAAATLLTPDRIRPPGPDGDEPLPPPLAEFADHTDALGWLDAERANQVAAVQHAATHGPRPTACRLANALKGYFSLRTYGLDWQTVASAGLAAAEAEGDLYGQALAHLSLGAKDERLSDYPRASAHVTRALALAEESGWQEARAVALGEIGILCRRAGRLDEAADYFGRALEVAREIGRTPIVAARLVSLGNLFAESGDLPRAAEYYAQALPVIREVGSRGGRRSCSATSASAALSWAASTRRWATSAMHWP